jgi:hypothetical protein
MSITTRGTTAITHTVASATMCPAGAAATSTTSSRSRLSMATGTDA